MKKTGLLGPDHTQDPDGRRYRLQKQKAPEKPWFVRFPIRIRTQPVLPNCTGEALAGQLQLLFGIDPSGRDLWREAQRREGVRFDPQRGAYLYHALEGGRVRGYFGCAEGEVFNTANTLSTWPEDRNAFANARKYTYWRIEPGDTESLYAALYAGACVVDGGPLREDFFYRDASRASVPAGLDELGGDSNGHAMGIIGFLRGGDSDLILYQNSWGSEFGGCFSPEGDRFMAGCFWAKAETFSTRWDCYAIAGPRAAKELLSAYRQLNPPGGAR